MGENILSEWFNDKISGQGTYEFSNGNVYDGMFKNGKMNGQAEVIHLSMEICT